ncbi:MAG TPA: bifunctional diaminohydroxyphosphoribosylaminopyrimidine deaminase/5-amino-6-(5-phosphoribosylamino)uracil reductase RibD, partial [Acidimicrobiia bacterium]|nr:bifunctional diaminohydroxyphosphoribosylaminopyrimidine deaminase/5-amino-6-(5-phosphoribosylamino)uracil reductase RibD [Acidimicrobiia bacterium]
MGSRPHLSRAYELARRHHTHPNPRVGAVVVSSSNEVLGEGAHTGPGHDHAEVVALDRAGDARGATLYVSLEPCTFQGRTPPCVDRVIASGVSKVVIGAIDPDARVAGSGVAALREAGIGVEVVDDSEARALDPAYFHHRETGQALVVAKFAMTLDGSIAAVDGTSQWITSEKARRDAHALRAEADVVVIGSGT